MSSNETKAKASGGTKGSKDPKVAPLTRASGSVGGQNNVHELIQKIKDLRVGDLEDLRAGLVKAGLSEILGMTPQGSRSIPAPRVTPTEDPAPHEAPQLSGDSQDQAGPSGSGATRRTMIRKARKMLRDSQGNAEGTQKAISRLEFLAGKYETSLEDLLPDGIKLPDDLPEDDPSETEAGEASQSGNPLSVSKDPKKGTPKRKPSSGQGPKGTP